MRLIKIKSLKLNKLEKIKMPLSKAPARCFYCIEDAKEKFILEHPDDELVISDILDQTADCITSRTCLRCNNRFCSLHASPVDQSDCCEACLPFEDIQEYKSPLVSQDATGTHIRRGYRIVPTGPGYKTLPKAITDLSDEELDAFILEKANQIHFIEKQRDYLKVAQSTAKLEKSDREVAAARVLRGIKVLMPKQTGIKITGSKDTGNLAKGVTSPGFDMAAFLKFAAAKKAAANAGKVNATQASPSSPGTSPGSTPALTRPAVTAKKEGVVIPASPPPLVPDPEQEKKVIKAIQNSGITLKDLPSEILTPAESAREAEIEAMLEGGEPNE